MSGQRSREGPSDHQRRNHSRTSNSNRNRNRSRSPSTRADLSFSVSHLERLLREGHYAQRFSSRAPVYLAAIIEYLTTTVLELAGNEAQKIGRRRITPELLDMAIHNNALLSGFFGNTTISQVAPGWQ
ncbi:PREDICTED: histone H2A-Bbd type 2/3-like [Miniopterus natalensis]|uniref:histone H2A-Bbd type 2/3 n=1 Tax=Miniopterus natalensis TaxID=291302 RepID=UPI0007A6ED6E|nr:PREDICTED: histone H2A-Bbd type 2/3 [Miniopterus natalensis]XP_016072406.1 PREDICTED: histone H2A-Bbd type 2/3-like [Miniopterus natalensis]